MENLVPNANHVNCIIMRCDLINNQLSSPCDVLFSFNASDFNYGSNIYIQNQSLSMMSMKSGSFISFNLSFYDQNFNQLKMLDNNICVQLVI